ncbi:MAG: hypothetical protein ACT4QE_25090 [Anaerolineales bacterium]
MSSHELTHIVEPLVQHGAFSSAEVAVRELVADYILRQIDRYRERIAELERQYGMPFEKFGGYLRARSAQITHTTLEKEEQRRLAQAVMQEEDDWQDWKEARDFLNGWLGIQAEARR